MGLKVVLAGGYDTQNFGDHAALWGLKQVLPEGSQITLLSRHPELPLPVEVIPLKNLDANSKAEAGKYFRGFNIGDSTEHMEEIRKAISDCDVVLLGGGRMFVDYTVGYMRGHLAYFAELTKLAKWHNKPVGLINNTFVPLSTELGKEQLGFIQENAAFSIVRDMESHKVVRSRRAPDLAYLLARRKIEREREPIMAVNVRSYAWRGDNVEEWEARLRGFLVKVAEGLSLELKFVPQQIYGVDTPEMDDRQVADRIFSGQESCVSSMDEALEEYASASCLVSMRRHGIIMAATRNTPSIAIESEGNTHMAAQEVGTITVSPEQASKAIDFLGHRMKVDSNLDKLCLALAQEAETVYKDEFSKL